MGAHLYKGGSTMSNIQLRAARLGVALATVMAVSLTLAAPVARAAAPIRCTDLVKLRIPGNTMQIQKAEGIPAGAMPMPANGPPGPPMQLPAYCRVEGVIEPRTGVDGKPYAIRFAVALPDKWNGRFLMQGGGGLNGTLQPPLGAQAAGDSAALARGFAVASTDSGHQGAGFDGSFLLDQQAALNFLYQSVGKVSVVAKQIVAAHYGKTAAHNYFVGCSTGGREAMILSQRYPDEYDGIVAGAPAMRTNYSNLAVRWITTSLNSVAPVDAAGKAQTDKALSPGDRKLFIDALLKSCDALDGIVDGMIFNTRACHFDPAVLACSGAKTDSCLTTAQVNAVKQGFAGPKTSRGRQVYPGFLYDTGNATSGRGLPGLLVTGFAPEGNNPTGSQMDIDAEDAIAHDGREMAGDSDAWTNLSTFTGHRGKLIFYHGNSDPWFSALETVRYYEQLAKDNPKAPVQDWSRLFLVPGMGHCGGGEATLDRFNMLDAIVDWVEQDKAPAQVIATGAAFPGRSRPLCPYPQHTQYAGSGNPDAAASYRCAE
jgi:pimeloyl-ACP methyl ester carboxylesterase